jgi:hypothetical protein
MPRLEDRSVSGPLATREEAAGEAPVPKQKKPIVKPTISVLVGVLEATIYTIRIAVDLDGL